MERQIDLGKLLEQLKAAQIVSPEATAESVIAYVGDVDDVRGSKKVSVVVIRELDATLLNELRELRTLIDEIQERAPKWIHLH